MTYSLEGRPEQYYILPKLCTDQETISKSLTAILGRIDSLVNSQQDIIKHNSMVIEEQHNRILRYENDVLFKSKKELLMELIGIADQIKFTLDEQQANKDYESLLEAIKALGEWVNGSLQTETVRKFEISKNITSQLNAKYQEVTGSEPTENPNENGHYKTMLPGYFWTMPLVGSAALQTNNPEPKSFEFVLRPEYVVRLVFSGRTQTARQTSSQDETTPIRESKETETGEHKKTVFQRTISIDDKDDINHVNSKGNCKQEDSGRYPIDFGSEEDQIQNDRGINNNE